MVEARLLNRNFIGFDISSLATFIARTKTNPINQREISAIRNWVEEKIIDLSFHSENERPAKWIEQGYQRNISSKTTWPIRKLIEQAVFEIAQSNLNSKQKDFLRCSILKKELRIGRIIM